jgi:signal transduction histidine kinase
VVQDALVEVDNPPGVTVELSELPSLALPHELAVRTVVPLLQNALKYATHVRITASAGDDRIELTIADDGPGVAADMAGRLFEVGASTDGSGLGLPLARRIARSVGGDLALVQPASDLVGGATFCVSLPAAVR